MKKSIAELLIFTHLILFAPSFAVAAKPQIAVGGIHTVGLKSDGTVIAVGGPKPPCLPSCPTDVSSWTDIVQVSAGGNHTIGLKSDGTVLCVGSNADGQCNVSAWIDIIQVAAGTRHTVGLKRDGSVIATGDNYYGQASTYTWTNIIQITADSTHTVGLKSDTTIIKTNYPPGITDCYTQAMLNSVNNIKQIDASYSSGNCDCLAGLGFNGRIGFITNSIWSLDEVHQWSDLLQIANGNTYMVGLKSDGTVVSAGIFSGDYLNVESWTSILQVDAGHYYTVGLKSDGSVLCVGENSYGQCNVSEWKLFDEYTIDYDNDGMPDIWEKTFGLNPLVNDSNIDKDDDGFTNLQEYQAGTDPNDPKSIPKKKNSLPWLQLLLE